MIATNPTKNMEKTLALFDFDGTMTTRDSFNDFLKNSTPPVLYWLKRLVLYAPCYIFYKIGFLKTHELKSWQIKLYLAKKSEKDFEQYKNWFTNKYLPKILKQSALQRIASHKMEGHEVWIVSASFDFCIQDWCKKNDISFLCNISETKNGVPTGKFPIPECNYEEKVARIRSMVDTDSYKTIYAYGDTNGDKPMLALAQYPHFCFFN